MKIGPDNSAREVDRPFPFSSSLYIFSFFLFPYDSSLGPLRSWTLQGLEDRFGRANWV